MNTIRKTAALIVVCAVIAGAALLGSQVKAQPESPVKLEQVRTEKVTVIAKAPEPGRAWFVEMVAPNPGRAWFVEMVEPVGRIK